LHDAIYLPSKHNVVWTEFLKRGIAMQIGQGMAYLHAANPPIIHGDLRPTTVMLTNENICRIIDFGLAAAKEGWKLLSGGPRTKTECIAWSYQAPELLETGASVERDHKVDVYAYAVTILELFQQQSPAGTMGMRKFETMIKRGERPAMSLVKVPSDIVALISMAWHQMKAQRPEFIEILTRFSAANVEVSAQRKPAALLISTTPKLLSSVKEKTSWKHGSNALKKGNDQMADIIRQKLSASSISKSAAYKSSCELLRRNTGPADLKYGRCFLFLFLSVKPSI
jgi:serine/threonine protein kinase